MDEILAPRAEPVLAELQIAEQVEPEAVILDRGKAVINADIRDQPVRRVVVAPPGQPVAQAFLGDLALGVDREKRYLIVFYERNVGQIGILSPELIIGHLTIAPRLMLALWLYATSESVGSARALARLSESHDAYRWLCGGVSVNYHTLSDFRLCYPDLLDDLLTRNVAALSAAGAIDLDEVVQDGMWVRAAAGSGLYRRGRSSC